MNKLSVIMPIYNAESYLHMAIDSILSQSFKDIEIILVDDGSTDRSGEICDSYLTDDRIKVIHKKNNGLCSARNDGLKIATSKYVTFMDNDDVIASDTYEENLKLLEENQADWIKFGKTEILVDNENILKQKQTQFENGIYDNEEIIDKLFLLKCKDAMTFVWDSIFDLSIIRENNLSFDETFKSGNEDIDFCEEYAIHSKKLIVNKKCYYNHFTRFGISASSKSSEEKLESYLYLLKKENERYESNNILYDEKLYTYIITKQILYNICSKLNDSPNLSHKEKIRRLKDIYDREELDRYKKIEANIEISENPKLFIYEMLFKHRLFNLLLSFDSLSRKIIKYARKRINHGDKR